MMLIASSDSRKLSCLHHCCSSSCNMGSSVKCSGTALRWHILLRESNAAKTRGYLIESNARGICTCSFLLNFQRSHYHVFASLQKAKPEACAHALKSKTKKHMQISESSLLQAKSARQRLYGNKGASSTRPLKQKSQNRLLVLGRNDTLFS